MVAKSFTVIDVGESEELSRLVDKVGEARGPVILSREGRGVAILSPFTPEHIPTEPVPHKEVTEEDRTASRAALGGWAGNVDVDRLREALKESRQLPSRPPLKLDR